MPVEPRFVCRFVAEPPQEPLPGGRWAATLERHFLGACDTLSEEEDGLGEPVGGRRVVVVRDAEEHEQPRADLRHELAVDAHRGPRDTLDERSHVANDRWVVLASPVRWT